MAFDFIKDRKGYFDQQYKNSEKSILPFVENEIPMGEGCAILEIGCSEAGVLKVFSDRGCFVMGIELRPEAIELANEYMKPEVEAGRAQFMAKNIYDIDVDVDLPTKFNLIILKDVIEHIPDTDKLIRSLKPFLKPDGKIFVGWPPWQMPFGGHQQMCESKILSRMPFMHLLPKPLYKTMLMAFGESEETIEELLLLPDTGCSIERFFSIVKKENYTVSKRQFYFINPIYEYKFGLKTRLLWPMIASMPVVRNFATTSAYTLIKSV